MVTTTFESTHDIDLHGCDESVAAASDNNPVENVKPFAFCSHICSACTPVPFSISFGFFNSGPWFSTAKSIADAGEEVLTEKSFFLCMTGGMAKVEFENPGQDSIRVGEGKTIQDLLEKRKELMEQIEQGQPYNTGALQEQLNELNKELEPRIDNIPYNALQQTSSHNSYDTDDHSIGIKDQFGNYGTHSFELDIHEGDPPAQWPFPDNKMPNDFYVYHNVWDQGTRYNSFSEAMGEVGELGNTYPVTVFVDLKDELNSDGDHTSATFDQILEDKVGSENLYTPQDLIRKAQAVDPTISTLAGAVATVGWPTLGELNGKVMVVATDNVGSYTGDYAFTAPGAKFDDNGNFKPYPNAIFYNKKNPSLAQVRDIQSNGFVARGYYFNGEENFEDGIELELNHITTNDIEDSWTDLSTLDFPFKILDSYLEQEAECIDGDLAVVTGATLTCPKAVMGSDIKFFRMNK